MIGVAIEVKGDTQRYQLGLQTSAGINYWVDLTSTADWQRLTFEFADFVAKRRGRVVTDAPVLNPSDLTGFNVMISHQQHGEFTLQIRDISILTAPTT
jgi:monofunctional biosynthetic peptidoglycan transglycosylase